MTDYQTTPVAAPAPKKSRNWVLPVGVGVGALVLGLAVGATTVEPEVVTVEKEVIVEVSSADCLEALDLADEGFTIVADIMESIYNTDVSGIRAGNQDLNNISGDYNSSKSSCRAGS